MHRAFVERKQMAVSTVLAISHEPRTRINSIDLPGTAFSLVCYCLFLVRHGARSSDYTVDLEMDGRGSCFQKLWWSVLVVCPVLCFRTEPRRYRQKLFG